MLAVSCKQDGDWLDQRAGELGVLRLMIRYDDHFLRLPPEGRYCGAGQG
jgi:hypothetical protein